MKVAATYSIKGGVGKTSTAVNLAFEAARGGARVLVWDLDPQGAATFLFRVRPKVRGGSRGLIGVKGELAPHVRGSDLSPVHVVPADFSVGALPSRAERIDVAIAIPADGPSFGTAPAGTCTWSSPFVRRSPSIPNSTALEQKYESAICANSFITSPN